MSGEHFDAMTVDSLTAVMAGFDASRYQPAAMQAHARRFDVGVFNDAISGYVTRAYEAFKAGSPHA
jgi:hypothetical protein